MNSSTAMLRPLPNAPSAASISAAESTRVAPDAPAPSRGLTISGKPTCSANAWTSAAVDAAVDWAHGTPPSRSTSFIAGLSRHRNAVRTDVPGMPAASRTRAIGRMWASTVASSRSTCRFDWMKRSAPSTWPSSVTLPTSS